ncbi:MAG: TonB-dependent receptor [Deltaproteobacteria bacterium]|nr:TonB-dependent receptor [Deltaproteobacteria bacterium]
MKKLMWGAFLAALVLGFTPQAWATNGMNMIGTGAVSSGMGGADVAVPAGCTAIAGNPANLAQTCDQVLSLGTALLMPTMSVQTQGSESEDNEFQLFPLPFVGYAQRIGTSPWAVGVGVFAQGGMGVDFKEVGTPYGNKDHLYSQVAFLRVAPTVAYNVTDALSLGLSAYVGYATVDYEFWPNTAGGQDVQDLNSFTFSGRLGANYQINDQWAVGASYTSESALDFQDGELKQNFGPGGIVTYNDVTMDDFTWPQQIEAGLSYRPVPRLLLAFDVSWVNWSSAIETVIVHAKDPNKPVPPGYEELNVPFVMNWDDQWVFALGAQYEINEMWTVRAGYNYGQNPVPSDSLNPLFPAIVEHHLTAGFTCSVANWDFDFAYEHGFSNSDTNTGAPSQTNPFSGTEVSHYQNTLHFMVSYRF